ncbi:hypothetical protein [Streptococcus cuniculi]|uniref:Uncharacterized protein n=1 Tax=Streptococcus cuniculi TaxID=1432788 RepID=A0A4Y9JBQ8_9STRE|nr:hypothetical protein [Streptococcus cuniculi]MBF0777985.1 hypothetical protein [Streptococcus cuniculi]TFU98277.1 hypothetical protein E4T82_04545 [Streptococcus cuniculi]
MFQMFIGLYVSLPFVMALSMKNQLSTVWRIVYALPMLLALLAVLGSGDKATCQGLLLASLFLAWVIRPLGGKFVFGQVHLSHFLVHGIISLLLVFGLFFF